jgi:hypothetical protein
MWYYFRMGYATYLTFVVGWVSTLVTVYYLAIKNVPPLLDIFPKFLPFVFLATVVGVPISVIVGWIHLKRSRLFSSEIDVSMEANPYNFILVPGKEAEVFYPVLLTQLRILRKLSESNQILTNAEKAELDQLEDKIMGLLRGRYVGTPRRGTNF